MKRLALATLLGDGSGSGDGSWNPPPPVKRLALALAALLVAGSAHAQHCHVPAATYHPPAQQVINYGHGHNFGHAYQAPYPYPFVAFFPIAGYGYQAPPTQAQVQATDEMKELRAVVTEQTKALAILAEAVSKLKK